MSKPIQTELRTYMSYLDTQVAPMTIDEITELRFGTESVRPIGPLSHPVDLEPHRRWLVAVAAAVVVLVLLGSFTLLSQVTDPDASPVAGPVVPSTVTPSVDTLSWSGWSRIPIDGSLRSVVAGGPGLVAVGSDDLDAAVWTSPDGVTWSRVPHDAAVFGDAHMNSVIAGGPGFVAVGSDWSGDDPNAAVWTSPDAITWSRVPHDEEIFGGLYSQIMESVTVAGPGLVAVGFDGPHDHIDGGGLEDMDAAVWTSVDGDTWSRIPANDAVFGGEGNQVMLSVTAGGPGLVAVGFDGPEGGEVGYGATYSAVWTSLDGTEWSRVTHDELVFGVGHSAMSSVAAGGPGLVAVGYDETLRPIWTSIDGITWSRVADDESIINSTHIGELLSVIVTSSGLVAVGEADTMGGTLGFTSVDGVTWSRIPANDAVPGGAEYQVISMAAGGPGLVAVGEGAVWVAQLEGK